MILMLEDEPFGSFFFGVSKKQNCCLCPSKASVGMTMDASEKTQKTPSPIPTWIFCPLSLLLIKLHSHFFNHPL